MENLSPPHLLQRISLEPADASRSEMEMVLEDCETAFNKLKDIEQLCANPVLTHYDPTLPLKLACDASHVQYGVGAVTYLSFTAK